MSAVVFFSKKTHVFRIVTEEGTGFTATMGLSMMITGARKFMTIDKQFCSIFRNAKRTCPVTYSRVAFDPH